MGFALVELGRSGNVEQRWKIPIIRKMNIPSTEISAKCHHGKRIDSLIVGRDVSKEVIEAFFDGYFVGRDMPESIMQMRLVV